MAASDLIGPRMGSRSGRIIPVNFAPTDGVWAYVMGSDEPGIQVEVGPGDLTSIEQGVDVTSITSISGRIKFRQPVTVDTIPEIVGIVTVAYPTQFVGGETLTLAADFGGGQLVTFLVTDQTQQQVIDRINSSTTGLTADAEPEFGALRLRSDTGGASAEIEVVSGTAVTRLGLPIVSLVGRGIVYAVRISVGSEIVAINPASGTTLESDWVVRTDHLTGVQILKVELSVV